jgi:hypothetical protein
MGKHVKGNYFSKMMDGVGEYYVECSRIDVVNMAGYGQNLSMK